MVVVTTTVVVFASVIVGGPVCLAATLKISDYVVEGTNRLKNMIY